MLSDIGIKMNENLKQIAIKAQVEHCISHVRLQEFADLIVKACMDQCFTDADAESIAEYFGIEE